MATIDGGFVPLYSSTAGCRLRATYSTSTSAGKATVTVTKLELVCEGGQTVDHNYSYNLYLGGNKVAEGNGSTSGTVSSYTIWSGSYSKEVSLPAGGTASIALSASDSFIYNGSTKNPTISTSISVQNVPAATYSISYNANGGTGAPSAQTKTHGVNLTLSSTKPTKAALVEYPTGTISISYNANGGVNPPSASTGTYTNKKTTTYTFSKWNTNSGGTGTNYDAGGTYTANAAATLYAQYTSSSSTVRYSNPSITIPTGQPTREGYRFLGWADSATAIEPTYFAGTSYTFSANKTLYAVWEYSSKVYVGVNGKAKKTSKAYVGVNGKAKLIKKIYIGVNGKAKKVIF